MNISLVPYLFHNKVIGMFPSKVFMREIKTTKLKKIVSVEKDFNITTKNKEI